VRKWTIRDWAWDDIANEVLEMVKLFTFCMLFFLAIPARGADPPQPPAPPPSQVPKVDPSKALTGAALVEALRRGGYVMYMRHAQYRRATEECNEPNLDSIGEEQARKVGAALRERRIPVGVVRVSRLCRAIETARLLEAGPVEVTPDLLPSKKTEAALHAARRRLLAETPRRGTNTILVSHVHEGEDPNDELRLQLCEIIVFRPDGQGGTVPVARVRPEDWAGLPK
jgi:hypothetical protein